ncbi:hypothetical protein [Propionivibrio sp.]|uniref:hypothetical protein n=1 Tax=Propionivibrio sp. TaxID=2212460 RepID=UPI003BF0776B
MSEEANGPVDESPLNVLAIGLLDRPGAAHGVAEVFSGRGLQMEAFHGTAGSLNPDGQAQALILFRADPDRANLVIRVIRRLSSVSSAELLAADDPRIIQSVLIAISDASAPMGINITPLDPQTALAAGSPTAMQTWLASSVAPRRLGALRLDLLLKH